MAVNPDVKDLARQFHEAQAKHIELLMALAASCIALSVHRTTGMHPTWPMVLLAAAVLCWAGSLVAGVRNRHYYLSTTFANVTLLRVEAGEHPETGRHPQLIEAASKGLLSAMERNSDMAAKFADWQFYLLLVGAGLFVVWHVVDMFSLPAVMPQATP